MSVKVLVSGTVQHETEKAILLAPIQGGAPEWLPRSQVVSRSESDEGIELVEITCWIAEQKKLLDDNYVATELGEQFGAQIECRDDDGGDELNESLLDY